MRRSHGRTHGDVPRVNPVSLTLHRWHCFFFVFLERARDRGSILLGDIFSLRPVAAAVPVLASRRRRRPPRHRPSLNLGKLKPTRAQLMKRPRERGLSPQIYRPLVNQRQGLVANLQIRRSLAQPHHRLRHLLRHRHRVKPSSAVLHAHLQREQRLERRVRVHHRPSLRRRRQLCPQRLDAILPVRDEIIVHAVAQPQINLQRVIDRSSRARFARLRRVARRRRRQSSRRLRQNQNSSQRRART